MMYIILSESAMQNLCGTYQEGGITREIVMGRKLNNSNTYAIDAVLRNSQNEELSMALKNYPTQNLEDGDFETIQIR